MPGAQFRPGLRGYVGPYATRWRKVYTPAAGAPACGAASGDRQIDISSIGQPWDPARVG
jgi:hypothetical protein